jgi:superfamily II DNA/RNA helicase
MTLYITALQKRLRCTVANRICPSTLVNRAPRSYFATHNRVDVVSTFTESSKNPIFDNIQTSFAEFLPGYPTLVDRLKTQGLEYATSIQSKTIPAILSGKDTIIGAETGSGKTLSYMLPLFIKYGLQPLSMKSEEHHRQIYPGQENSEGQIASVSPRRPFRGLILAPTNELCDQIFRMSSFLFSPYEPQLSIDRRGDSFFDWMTNNDDSKTLQITLCTPRHVSSAVRSSDHFSPEHPFRALDFLVLDEADMLMEGSYLKDVESILDKIRLVRRTMIQEGLQSAHARHIQSILSAATIPTYGVKSTKNLIQKSFPHAIEIQTHNLHQHHPAISQEFVPLPKENYMNEAHMNLILKKIMSLHMRSQNSSISPLENLDISPEALASVQFATMVFFNTAEHARQMFALFQQTGYTAVTNIENQSEQAPLVTEVHGMVVPKAQRERNLQSFRQSSAVKILLCTDACARGLDIPKVHYVIQGEFALNVVQHLHRIGRASRGGRHGYACNFFLPEEAGILVQAITNQLQEVDLTTELDKELNTKPTSELSSIEQSFSRKRGFRKKYKKGVKNSNANSADKQPLLV